MIHVCVPKHLQARASMTNMADICFFTYESYMCAQASPNMSKHDEHGQYEQNRGDQRLSAAGGAAH